MKLIQLAEGVVVTGVPPLTNNQIKRGGTVIERDSLLIAKAYLEQSKIKLVEAYIAGDANQSWNRHLAFNIIREINKDIDAIKNAIWAEYNI